MPIEDYWIFHVIIKLPSIEFNDFTVSILFFGSHDNSKSAIIGTNLFYIKFCNLFSEILCIFLCKLYESWWFDFF